MEGVGFAVRLSRLGAKTFGLRVYKARMTQKRVERIAPPRPSTGSRFEISARTKNASDRAAKVPSRTLSHKGAAQIAPAVHDFAAVENAGAHAKPEG